MADPAHGDESGETEAQKRAAAALQAGVAEIATPAEARRTLDALEQSAGSLADEAVARTRTDASPQEQAAAIEQAADRGPAMARPARVIATAAAQSANAAPEEKQTVDAAVAAAMGGDDAKAGLTDDSRRGRRLLRRELFHRLRPWAALDALAFAQINQLPHTRLSDTAMSRLSWVMTGGTGWFLFLLLASLQDRKRGWKAAAAIAPALWLATYTVEYPIKKWFGRRRPFISLVEAIIVGRKPGSSSFPSGHSAAAFAGAVLLARHYPRRAGAFHGLAAVVAFSRIYLGAHYPGDVISGALLGAVLARVYSRLLRKLHLAVPT